MAKGRTLGRNMRSKCRCSMCPAIHISSRSWLRSSSTHEPSDPPPKVVSVSFVFPRGAPAEVPTRRGFCAGGPAADRRRPREVLSQETVNATCNGKKDDPGRPPEEEGAGLFEPSREGESPRIPLPPPDAPPAASPPARTGRRRRRRPGVPAGQVPQIANPSGGRRPTANRSKDTG